VAVTGFDPHEIYIEGQPIRYDWLIGADGQSSLVPNGSNWVRVVSPAGALPSAGISKSSPGRGLSRCIGPGVAKSW
jgi:hypothetical protein